MWLCFGLLAVSIYMLLQLSKVRLKAKDLISRLITWELARQGKLKERRPQFIKMSTDLFSSMEDIIDNTGGPVLEIGAGSGANLAYYPQNTRLITVDLSGHCHPYLEENLKRHSHVKLEKYLVGNAEDMKDLIDDNSCSCVVSTGVLCCTDQQKVLDEIKRILKPGGRFYFIEHIIGETGSWRRWFQLKLNPTWQSLVGKCSMLCNANETIENFDFANLNAYIMYRKSPSLYVLFQRTYVGYADKANKGDD